MNRRQVLMGSIFSFMSTIGSYANKVFPITHVATVHLDPARYSVFIHALDAEMSDVGLSRYRASEDVNVLRGRDVLYANYRFHKSDTMWFLSATDFKKVGIIELQVYATVVEDEQARRKAIVRIDSVLAEFGAKLSLRSAAPKN